MGLWPVISNYLASAFGVPMLIASTETRSNLD